MARRIEEVLKEIDAWYNELPGGTERPALLSKLALLELCGWLEERFDLLAVDLATKAGVASCTSVLESIDRTYGFRYADHIRGVLLTIGGEIVVDRAEKTIETQHPGDLERLRANLGSLWKQRCDLAHGSSVKVQGKQQSLSAPSWSLNQQRVLGKLIDKYETALHDAVI